MAENRGVAPPNMSTPTGQVRALLGDLDYEPFDPPRPGMGMYQKMSDAEIEAFLGMAEGSKEGAVYFAYLQLASEAALSSKNVKDMDLQVDLTKRSGDLRAIAQMWKDRWDEQTGGDIFEVFSIGSPAGGSCWPEASARPAPWCPPAPSPSPAPTPTPTPPCPSPIGSVDLCIYRGDTFTQEFIFTDSEGVVQALPNSSWRAWFTPKGLPHVEFSVDASLSGEGKIIVSLSSAQTSTLTVGGVWDLELDNAGEVTTYIRGRVTVAKDVTG